MTAGATVTYRTAAGENRRVRFEPLERPDDPADDWLLRISETGESHDGEWRRIGQKVVRNLEIGTSDGAQVSIVFPGP